MGRQTPAPAVRTRLPYKVGFEVRATRVQPPSTLEADATGELEGTGRWMLTPDDGGTLGALQLGSADHPMVDEPAGAS
jgi:hypothetical protein